LLLPDLRFPVDSCQHSGHCHYSGTKFDFFVHEIVGFYVIFRALTGCFTVSVSSVLGRCGFSQYNIKPRKPEGNTGGNPSALEIDPDSPKQQARGTRKWTQVQSFEPDPDRSR
jgi:hypothetical protein